MHPQPVVPVADLLAGIEDEGEVDRGFCDRDRQGEHHGDAALHVHRTESRQDVAVDPALRVRCRPARCRDDRREARRRSLPSSVRATTEFPSRLDREGAGSEQIGLDCIGQRRLVVTDRGDRDDLGGQGQQIRTLERQPAIAGSDRDTVLPQHDLEFALSCLLPGSSLLNDEGARQEELPSRVLAPARGVHYDTPGRHNATRLSQRRSRRR